MPTAVDAGLAALFGSEDRVRTLAALANSSSPLTAYRVAKIVEMRPPNVYRELKRLLKGEVVTRTTMKDGSTVWQLREADLRSFFRARMRVTWSDDLVSGARDRERRAAAVIRRSAEEPLDLSRFSPGRRLTAAEIQRRRRKDQVLARAGAKISVRKPG
jgi:DNA-binding transcriptional ArsR family regulator